MQMLFDRIEPEKDFMFKMTGMKWMMQVWRCLLTNGILTVKAPLAMKQSA
jgi:hypothetical protein